MGKGEKDCEHVFFMCIVNPKTKQNFVDLKTNFVNFQNFQKSIFVEANFLKFYHP